MLTWAPVRPIFQNEKIETRALPVLPRQPMTIRAWLVDLDGTLYFDLLVRAAMIPRLALAGRQTTMVVRTFRKVHVDLRRTLRAAVENAYDLQLERTAALLSLDRPVVDAIVEEWMIQRPGRWLYRFRRTQLLREIAAFRSVGGLTAIVSDYPASVKLQALRARDAFDVVVANGEANRPGRLKPWPDGYLLAARMLGVEPAECLVIGDKPKLDGEAARGAGMSFRRV